MDYSYESIVLKNGLKLLLIPDSKSKIFKALVMVNVGSRDEKSNESGIAHFLEHVMFKGTKKRSSKEISETLDKLGTEYNAFTSKEYTGYYIKGYHKSQGKIMDVLFDLFTSPQIKHTDVNKERNVIYDEIRMYLDDNNSLHDDAIYEHLYDKHEMARNIAGTVKSVSKLTTEQMRDFRSRYYVPNNTVIGIAGNIDKKKIMEYIVKYFKGLKSVEKPSRNLLIEKQTIPNIKIVHKPNTSQIYMSLIFRTLPNFHPDNKGLSLLAGVLSQGNSSRLFSLLREKMGVTYYNRSYNENFMDSGIFRIDVGMPPSKVFDVTKAIVGEIKKLKEEPVMLDELNKVKTNYINRILFNYDNVEPYLNDYVNQLLVKGKIEDIKTKLKSYKKYKPTDLHKLAKKYFDKKSFNLVILGNVKYSKEELNKLKNLLNI